MMEITLVIATLVQRFHLGLPGQDNLEPEPKVSLRPKGGGQVKLLEPAVAAPVGSPG
jgi:cytochrome P450